MMLLAIIGYSIMLAIYPRIISDWWYLQNLSGVLFLGIPLEEIIWFGLFGLFFGPMAEFWKKPSMNFAGNS